MRLGIDIGGTKTEGVVLYDDGTTGPSLRLPTAFGADAVLETAMHAIGTLAARVPTAFTSIGVGIPGTVDADTGRVVHAVNLGIENLELGSALADRLGMAVTVENDVKAAALGAHHLLGGVGSMAFLNLGTGLAAGLVLDGRLWRGATGVAGEIGHIPVDPDGPLCPCGQRGCLETVASGSAVARQWPGEHTSPVRALFGAAAGGDLRAVEVRDRLVENIAASVRIVVLTVDVELVVIGGGLSSLGEELLTAVRRVLVRWEGESPFLAAQRLPDRIVLAPHGANIAAIGAALVGMGPRVVAAAGG